MPSSYNGIWVSVEGYPFVVANPYTIWTTINHRHFSAYQVNSTDSGFSGLFNASRDMKPGYSPDPQIEAQYNLLSDSATSFPTPKLDVPMELPCVLVPEQTKTGDFGTVTINNVKDEFMHVDWTNAKGQVEFAGNLTKAGGDDAIDLTGAYVDRDIALSIADVGKGPKHTLVGTATLSGVKYKLKGLRVWSRGTVSLYSQTGDDQIGKGWVEWAPSPKFCLGIKGAKPQPADQILAFVELTKNGFSTGATHRLTRVPNQ
jgi:hypothetical protein